MTKTREGDTLNAMSYAPFLAAILVLWPVMGLLGGQGYAPLLALGGIAALFVARPKGPPAVYFVLAALFVLWTAISEYWSPASSGFVSGSLLAGNFAIDAASARLIATLIFATLVIAAALQLSEASAPLARRVILGAFFVQGALVFATAIFAGPLLALYYGDDPLRVGEGVQNLMRNGNAFALVLPLLIGWLWTRGGLAYKAASVALVGLSALAFMLVDSQAGLFALVGMGLGGALIAVLPRSGFRWMFGALGAYVAAAPLVVGTLIGQLREIAPQLPGSFQSRLWSWEVVISRMTEAPMRGHGLDATRTWRETYAAYPEWMAQLPDFWANYPVVPGHPHNMALHIWAETGFVGAVLAGLGLMAIAFRLPRPEAFTPSLRFAIAGLAGAIATLASFTYSVWNEAFWSSVCLVIAAIILFHRTPAARP